METQAKLSLAQLRSATRSLSSEERGILLDDLIVGLNELESSEDPSAVETAWKEEIARRADRVERGEATGIPAADVKSRLRERLPWLK